MAGTDIPSDVVTIVSAGDDSYLLGVVVAIDSAVRMLDPALDVDVVVLSVGMSCDSHGALRRASARWRPGCRLRIMEPVISPHLPNVAHFSLVTYARLALPALLPATARAIYLDADVHVRRDIAHLWRVDLEGAPVGAVVDYMYPVLAEGLPVSGPNLGGARPYFNAGVLVMDLERWRIEGLAGRIEAWMLAHREEVRFADQDGVNAVLAGRIRELAPRWNVQVGRMERALREGAGDPSGWRAENAAAVQLEPWITHYVGGKPWTGSGLRLSATSITNHARWHAALRRSRAVAAHHQVAILCRLLQTLAVRSASRVRGAAEAGLDRTARQRRGNDRRQSP